MSLSFLAQAMDSTRLLINHHSFYLEVPQTVKEYSQGLMGRTQLAPSRGMLFVFNPQSSSPPKMWMKNTLLPLDMLFIGPELDIKCIFEQTKPLSLNLLSCDEAIAAVIELNAGEVKQFQLRKGMKISTAP